MRLAPVTAVFISCVAICCVLAPMVHAQGSPPATQQGAITIDLNNALERARSNSQQLQSAALDIALAREDRSQAKAALLPSLNYFNEYIYTQGNGTEPGIFIANDGVHVYSSQAQIHQELFSPERLAEYRRTAAAQALATAKRDIVERGLAATVVEGYYTVLASQRRIGNAQRALEEAQRFVEVTRNLEQGGEVAHADVIKAQLELQNRQRDLRDLRLAADQARIALAVLMFSDYRMDFTLVDDLATINPLPGYSDLESLSTTKSPELRAAEEGVRQEAFNISIARSAYLPSLSFDYFYGINANQFALRDRDGINRIGSSAQATLNIPVWDWWDTRSKVRQAGIRRQQAQLDLELVRRQLISRLHSLYLEAQAAQEQIQLLQASVDAATESLRLTNLRYEAGEVTVLEVVDALATLVETRNAHDDGLSRYHLALATIQILTGMI